MTDGSMNRAQRGLDDAVDAFVKADGVMPHDSVTTGWVLVTHQHRIGDDGHDESTHLIAYQGGSLPDHVALGLLQIASDTIRGVGRWGLAEDGDEG